MITNKDIQIENISYTNKDFGQIYPELVSQTKSLTDKWDPENTNESDPGIVLLKIAAFLGDKLNYNIDQNILQQFIVSANQESAFRQLCDMMGYSMRYYRSATGKISFRYLGEMGKETSADSSDIIAPLQSFKIKAFDTTFKTEDNIIYTLLEDMDVYSNEKTSTDKKIIEGSLKSLSVLGSDLESDIIQLYNLDDNNRLYFPEVMVAENGVFINKDTDGVYDQRINSNAWHRVDNLNNQDLGQKIFKFGFDSDKGFPYIQFPSDISDLIGSGLRVDYVVSKGSLGKVLNNKLSTFNSVRILNAEGQEILTSLDDNIYKLSNSSSIGAADKETITEAYNNFTKTVGTFETLVSCKDYSNYLNRYVDDDTNERLVSNVCVTDIRVDPNLSKEVFVRDSGGSYYTNILESDVDLQDKFNLTLHGCTPVNADITSDNLYNKGYNLLTKADLLNIDTVLQDIKCVNHDFKLSDKGISLIYGNYKLQVNLSTKYKVNSSEQKQILLNVKQALYNNFSADKVDFGEELPYDTLVKVIESSDERIKSVNLAEPQITFNARLAGINNSTDITEETIMSNPALKKLLIDNILAGRLPFYYIDNSFSLDYDINLSQPKNSPSNIAGVLAELSIQNTTESAQDLDYSINKNEVIQLIEDSYLTTVSYPAYIYYSFYDERADAGSLVIPADVVYKLHEGQHLYIHYTDSSDIKRYIEYTEGQVIKSNFEIHNTAKLAEITGNVESKRASKYIYFDQRKVDTGMTYSAYINAGSNISGLTPFYAIGTNEQIDILEKHEIVLPKNTQCFWYIKPRIVAGESGSYEISNDKGSILFPYSFQESGKTFYYYILEEGEFFIYPNDDMTSLNILGSGTKLIYTADHLDRYQSDIIDIDTLQDSIEDEDVGTFRKYFKWETLQASLTVVESSISTFIEGEKINNFTLVSGNTLNSTWKRISSLTVNDEEVHISDYTNALIRTALYVNGSAEYPQQLSQNQSITIISANAPKDETGHLAQLTGQELSADEYIQIFPQIDSYNDLIVLSELQYSINADDGTMKPDKDGDNYLHTYTTYNVFNYSKIASFNNTNKTIANLIHFAKEKNKISKTARDEYMINKTVVAEFMGYGESAATTELTIGIDESYHASVNFFDTHNELTKLVPGTLNGTYDLASFLAGPDSEFIYISVPQKLDIYDYLKNTYNSETLQKIKQELSSYKKFDYLGDMNKYKYISSYSPILSFFDKNNMYNKLTIAKIDFSSSDFNIIGTSRIW